MDPSYIQKVKEWVVLDNAIMRGMEPVIESKKVIKKLEEDIQPQVEKKREIEDSIVEYIQKNKYEKLTVNINDGTIKFGKKTAAPPLSLKLIKALLEKYAIENMDDNIDPSKIYDFMIDNFEKKTSYFIKRDIATRD